jgi:hypothetical protein
VPFTVETTDNGFKFNFISSLYPVNTTALYFCMYSPTADFEEAIYWVGEPNLTIDNFIQNIPYPFVSSGTEYTFILEFDGTTLRSDELKITATSGMGEMLIPNRSSAKISLDGTNIKWGTPAPQFPSSFLHANIPQTAGGLPNPKILFILHKGDNWENIQGDAGSADIALTDASSTMSVPLSTFNYVEEQPPAAGAHVFLDSLYVIAWKESNIEYSFMATLTLPYPFTMPALP